MSFGIGKKKKKNIHGLWIENYTKIKPVLSYTQPHELAERERGLRGCIKTTTTKFHTNDNIEGTASPKNENNFNKTDNLILQRHNYKEAKSLRNYQFCTKDKVRNSKSLKMRL